MATAQQAREYRAANLEAVRARDRARGYRGKPGYLKQWRQADPRRMQCHNAVARALRYGQMVKMDCEVCGSKQAVAHHDDYDDPLRVRWLCQAHHKQWHRDNPGRAE